MTLPNESEPLSSEATEHLALVIALGPTIEDAKVVRLIPSCRLCDEIRTWAAAVVGNDDEADSE